MLVGVPVMVSVSAIVSVMVSVAGQLKCREPEAGENQYAADDGVLRALHGRAELEPHGDDYASEHDRHDYVSDAG